MTSTDNAASQHHFTDDFIRNEQTSDNDNANSANGNTQTEQISPYIFQMIEQYKLSDEIKSKAVQLCLQIPHFSTISSVLEPEIATDKELYIPACAVLIASRQQPQGDLAANGLSIRSIQRFNSQDRVVR
jgi:hypothetical protein